ncbi:MAG: RNA-binding S4 domain-containing protein, partial [Pseudaminobacter sp.]
LYEDMSPAPASGHQAPADAQVPLREVGSGRPTKRERRQIDRLRGGD